MTLISLINFSLYSTFIELRYTFARTYLGTLWNTFGLFVLIALLGTLFGAIFKSTLQGYRIYIPFLAAGIITWAFLSSCINESCSIFVRRARILQHADQPFLTIPLIVVTKHLVVFAQNVFFAVLVYVSFFRSFPVEIFPFVCGILLLSANVFWMSLLATIVGLRFRDLPQLIVGTLYVGFLLTPIIWTEDFLGRYRYLLDFNPAYHLVVLVRAPLLGILPPFKSWIIVLTMLVAGAGLATFTYRRVRDKIPYWL